MFLNYFVEYGKECKKIPPDLSQEQNLPFCSYILLYFSIFPTKNKFRNYIVCCIAFTEELFSVKAVEYFICCILGQLWVNFGFRAGEEKE